MNPATRKNILILGHNHATQFIDICNQYAKLFDRSKYKVTVAYLSGEPDKRAKERTQAEEVLFLNCSRSNIRYLKIAAIKKLTALCRERNFSIVICHRYKPIYIMLCVAQLCHIPSMYFVMHAMHTMSALSRKLIIAALSRDNMHFAGVSNAVRDDLRKNTWRVPKDRIITLYNSIDIEQTSKKLLPRQQARQFFQLPENAFVFGTIGRLAPEKDQKSIIQAFAKIKSQCLQAKLIFVGDGVLEKPLKKLTQQLSLTNDVIFTGFVPEAFQYLKAFDTFILSSTKEAFGRVLLEAMTAKVPVIGTKTHGIPEVIGDAGLLVEPRDSDMLAAAMLKLTEQTPEELIALGENAYLHVKNKFSLETFNETFWEIEKNT